MLPPQAPDGATCDPPSDRFRAIAAFLTSAEPRRFGSCDAVLREIDIRWPHLTEAEMERVIHFVANTPLSQWAQ